MPSRTDLGPLLPNKIPHNKYADQYKGLPFAAKPEWPDDTGFLFAEPDTVFTEEQAKKLTEYFADYQVDMSRREKRRRLEEMADNLNTTAERCEFQRLVEEWESEEASAAAAPWPAATSSYPEPSGESSEPPRSASSSAASSGGNASIKVDSFVQRGTRVTWEDCKPENISQAAQDITDTCNEGHRRGLSDFQWLGWSAEQYTWGTKARNAPKCGTHLYYWSAAGARKALTFVNRWEDKHLAYLFREDILLGLGGQIQGGFVRPPLGYYYTHPSTTNPGKTLAHHVNDRCAQPGTRKRLGHIHDKDRTFHKYVRHGECPQIGAPLRLPQEHVKCRWITQIPPREFCGREVSGWQARHEGDRTLRHYNL